MNMKVKQYLEIIRFAMNPDVQSVPDVKGMDWEGLYRLAIGDPGDGFTINRSQLTVHGEGQL